MGICEYLIQCGTQGPQLVLSKNSLSLMRSNLIGHTIFLASEKYRMTNQKPDTTFFTSDKIRIGFSRLSGRSCEVIE